MFTGKTKAADTLLIPSCSCTAWLLQGMLLLLTTANLRGIYRAGCLKPGKWVCFTESTTQGEHALLLWQQTLQKKHKKRSKCNKLWHLLIWVFVTHCLLGDKHGHMGWKKPFVSLRVLYELCPIETDISVLSGREWCRFRQCCKVQTKVGRSIIRFVLWCVNNCREPVLIMLEWCFTICGCT